MGGITKRHHDSQFKNRLGMAGEDPSLGGRRDDPDPHRSWLVDDAYDSAAGAARQLCLARGAGIRSLCHTDPAAAMAMAQPLARTSRRPPTVGARYRAPVLQI